MHFRLVILSLTFFMVSSTYAQVHKTLPKGVRLFAYRNVKTSPIDAEYNQSQALNPLSYDVKANAKTLSGLSTGVQTAFDQIRAESQQAYDDLTFGDFNLSAQAQVQVHGFGGGFGITDRLTVYGILPFYDARVNMQYRQDRGSNAQQVADQVADNGGDISGAISSIVSSIPSVNGNLIQSIVVNTLGYKPIGNWHGRGYGDFELGAMYLLHDSSRWGMATTNGIMAPTGRQSDPDLLQDIAFGDGQWDIFTELAVAYMPSNSWRFGTTWRYTYQAPSEKTLRIPFAEDIPLGDTKGRFDVKFGDRIDATISGTHLFNDWLSVSPLYEFAYQMPSKYESRYSDANRYLAANSDRIAHNVRLSGSFSTVTPYTKKKFLLPAVITMNVQQTVAGRNVPKMTRYEIEFRMYF
jgi:hypothetical protein